MTKQNKRKWVITTDKFKDFPIYTLMEDLNSDQIGPHGTGLGEKCMLKTDAERNPDWFVEVTNNEVFNEVYNNVRLNFTDLCFNERQAAFAAWEAVKAVEKDEIKKTFTAEDISQNVKAKYIGVKVCIISDGCHGCQDGEIAFIEDFDFESDYSFILLGGNERADGWYPKEMKFRLL